MLNIGIIGYGKMGQIRHKVISSIKDANIVSVHDPLNIDTEIENMKSSIQIIENPDIDAVFICTPNYLNKPLTIQCLQAGKHVFCEKPPAFTAKDVKEIRAAEKKSGKVLMYGFNHRHHDSIKYIKQLIVEKKFGKVLWMRGRYGKSVDKTFFKNWRAKKKVAGGGILIDQGIHMLDLFIYLGGDFDNIHAVVSNLYWKLNVEDNVFVTMENTKTGMSASMHSTMTQWRHLFSLEVFLEEGYFVLNGLKTSSNTYGDEILTMARNRSMAPAATWKDEKQITYRTDTSWKTEVEDFFSAVKSNLPITTGTSKDALKLMKIVDKIYSFKKKGVKNER